MLSVTQDLPFGQAMATLLAELAAQRVRRKVVLIRHSAREFVPGRHDLLNPLTDEGRAAARAFGERLAQGYRWRGYASPAERCVETASLALAAHAQAGGLTSRVRPVEGLGVFYVLDQMKMFRAMQAAGGLGPFLTQWTRGQVGSDVMLDADVAAGALARLLRSKLAEPGEDDDRADLLVSHDMTLGLVRDRLLNQHWDAIGPVEFLDGVVAYATPEGEYLRSPHGPAVRLR